MNQDQLKRDVAQAALDIVLPQLRPDEVIGIGTGSTANHFIDLLAPHRDRFHATVASSEQSAERLQQQNVTLAELNDHPRLRFYVDGADETNPDLALIKGGGAALTREKIIAACAETFICIADESKWVESLGTFPLPIEVVPMARSHVELEVRALGGRPVFREGVVTDNGGHIIDVHDLDITSPKTLEQHINNISGVISNGIFALRSADLLLLGGADGIKSISATPQNDS